MVEIIIIFFILEIFLACESIEFLICWATLQAGGPECCECPKTLSIDSHCSLNMP